MAGGNIYAATAGGLSVASVTAPGSFTNYPAYGDSLKTIVTDSQIFTATSLGLAIATLGAPGTFTLYNSWPGTHFGHSLFLTFNTIYLATEDGVIVASRVAPNTLSLYTTGNGLPSDDVTAVSVGAGKFFWGDAIGNDRRPGLNA